MSTITIDHVYPQSGIQGGRVQVACRGLDADTIDACHLVFGTTPTRPALASPTFLLGTVPDAADTDGLYLQQHDAMSNTIGFMRGVRLAENLHPVANPAIDRRGAIYTTVSGTKGQQVPVSIYRITPQGDVEPFASDILNATGLAFAPDGDLYVTSRHAGQILRVNEHGTSSIFAEGLGVVTGLAFDAQGHLHVGDRRGSVLRFSATGEPHVLAKLAPSATAYHLAFGDDGRLLVSYPTLSGNDQIYAITPDGEVQSIASGLGRAQGFALDRDQNLYIVSYMNGEGGVVKRTPEGEMTHVIAGVNLVGIAFGMDSDMILTDNSSVYRLRLGIQGRPLI
jgi:sugar lactone lactonase YvrE